MNEIYCYKYSDDVVLPDDNGMCSLCGDHTADTGLTDEVSIVWSVEDVHEVTKDMKLSDGQAREVLNEVKDKHDATIGVTWETLEIVADVLFG